MFDLIPFGKKERNLFSYLDQMEKDFFSNDFSDSSQFRTDILDKGDNFILQAELPGFEKQDIHIDIDSNTLTIHAEHDAINEEKKDNFVRRERKYGSFARSFDVSNIQSDKITAEYKNGVLTLDLPKQKANELPPSRRIEIQ